MNATATKTVRWSPRSKLWVATVHGPRPFGGTISLAHRTIEGAERWAENMKQRWAVGA